MHALTRCQLVEIRAGVSGGETAVARRLVWSARSTWGDGLIRQVDSAVGNRVDLGIVGQGHEELVAHG